MQQPIYWSLLGVAVLAVAAIRGRAGRPLLHRRAIPLHRWEWAAAGLGAAALAFHCGSMFFASWVDTVPGLQTPATAVRALDQISQWAYWVPAALLLLSVRRVWWPGPVLLAACFVGVGVTMFWSYPLSTHLGWLAAAVGASSAVFALLVAGPKALVRTARG